MVFIRSNCWLFGKFSRFISSFCASSSYDRLGWPTVFAQLKQKYGPGSSDNKEIVEQQAEGVYRDINFGEERMTSNECYDIDEKEGK